MGECGLAPAPTGEDGELLAAALGENDVVGCPVLGCGQPVIREVAHPNTGEWVQVTVQACSAFWLSGHWTSSSSSSHHAFLGGRCFPNKNPKYFQSCILLRPYDCTLDSHSRHSQSAAPAPSANHSVGQKVDPCTLVGQIQPACTLVDHASWNVPGACATENLTSVAYVHFRGS
eukprot:COSAG01_NODE_3010_length_6727_cov_4.275951_5_plen_174_part_00